MGSERGARVCEGKRQGVVGEDGKTVCESPDVNAVDEIEVDGGQCCEAAAGRNHGFLRSLTCNSSQDDATVKCWGSNDNGELGQGDTEHRGDAPNGGCPAQPTRCFGGREERVGWLLTVLPWSRDGGEPACGRSGGKQDGCLGRGRRLLHVRNPGKMRVGELGSCGLVGLGGIFSGAWARRG